MPILAIEMVVAAGETAPPGLAGQIADAAGEVLSASVGSTWVRLRTLPAGQYGESGGAPAGVMPVFVDLLVAQWPDPAVLQTQCAALADLVGRLCGRPPENVHILVQPPAAGRIAFGGKL